MKRILILALAMIAVALPSAAQDTSVEYFRGINSYNAYNLGSFDAVNMDNGNLTLTIPIISYPQKGSLPDFKLSLHYVGQSWYMPCYNNGYGTYCDWTPGSTAQTGPVVSFDPQYGWGHRICTLAACGNPCPCWTYFIADADGGIHNVGDQGGTNQESLDGTGLLQIYSGGVTDRDGVVYTYPTIKDPAGNTITNNYGNNPPTYTDSVGRTIPDIVMDMPTSQNRYQPGCTTEYFPVVSGGTAPITICVSTISITSDLPSDGYPVGGNYSGSTGMITSITLPNNTTWNFSYDSWGELSQVTTPTGGTVLYTWKSVRMYYYDQYVQEDAFYRGIATRTTNANDGTGNKQYSYSATLNGTAYAGMTDPDGNMIVITGCLDAFDAGCVDTSRNYYTPGGVLLKTVSTGYSSSEDHLDVYDPTPSMQYILPTSTSTLWPNGRANYVATTYDSAGSFNDAYCGQGSGNPCGPWPFPYGSVLEKQEYDYSTSTQPQASALLRQTSTQYQWQNSTNGYLAANLLSQPSSVIVCNGSAVCPNTSGNDIVSQTTYSCDDSGRASSCQTTPCGLLTTTNRYINSSTPLTSYTNYNSLNSKGMPTDIFDAKGNHTCYTYDSSVAYAYLSEIQHPNPASGSTCSTVLFDNYSYDMNTGLLLSHTDPNSQTTSYTYDNMRRLTSVSYPDGGSETFTYTDNTPPYFNYSKKITSGPYFAEQGNADGLGRLVRTITTVPATTCSGGYSYVDTTYDNEGRKFSVSNPYCTTSDTTYGLTQTYYDGLNRPVLVVPPDGTTPTSSVTCLANDICTSYSNNCTTVSDQAGKARESCTDGLGRMTGVWEDPNGMNYETDYTYDTLDNLAQVVQSGSRPRTFSYDWVSRLLSANNPESGKICYGTLSGSTCQQNGYDANGNLLYKTDARGVQATYSYDALNRLLGKTYSNNDPSVSYSYDGTGCPSWVTPGCYNLGHRTGMTDAAGSESWSYYNISGLGNGVTDQRTTNSVTKTFSYAYNYDGTIASIGYPSGRTITYTPNIAEQPVSAVDTTNSVNYATTALYTAFGALSSLSNGAYLISTYYYNNRLQPCRVAVNTSGTAPTSCGDNTSGHGGNVLDYTYGFDLSSVNSPCSTGFGSPTNNGNVASLSNNLWPSRSQNFCYDNLNRLGSAQTTSTYSSGASYCWAESYGYDRWANLTLISPITGNYTGCIQESGLSLAGYINSQNQITLSGFAYDAAGNVTSTPNPGGLSLLYDGESRLCSVSGTSCTSGTAYLYDGDGKRVEKTYGGAAYQLYWYGLSSDPLSDTDGSGNIADEYIFFNGKRIARRVGP